MNLGIHSFRSPLPRVCVRVMAHPIEGHVKLHKWNLYAEKRLPNFTIFTVIFKHIQHAYNTTSKTHTQHHHSRTCKPTHPHTHTYTHTHSHKNAHTMSHKQYALVLRCALRSPARHASWYCSRTTAQGRKAGWSNTSAPAAGNNTDEGRGKAH